jgi:hypothetical protein
MREQKRKQEIATAAHQAVSEVQFGFWGNREVESRALEHDFKAIAALPESGTFDQCRSSPVLRVDASLRNSGIRKIGNAPRRNENTLSAGRESQERQRREEQERAQRKRESEMDGYLVVFVYRYLVELEQAPEPRRIDWEGEILQYDQRIRVDIKPKLRQLQTRSKGRADGRDLERNCYSSNRPLLN